MKQNITKQQLGELSDKQIEKLFKYWWSKTGKAKNKSTPLIIGSDINVIRK